MRRITAILLISVATAGPVQAADWLTTLASQKGWNRFYVGANAGYGWATGQADATLGGATFSASDDLPGAIAGGQIGFNWQRDSLVLGVEADLQWSDQNNSSVICPPATCGTAVTLRNRIPWFGTIRGRLGTPIDRLLVYVTGGLSFGELRANVSWPTVGTAELVDNWIGWTVGAGMEMPFAGRWTAKLEYLYLDAGTIAKVSIGTAVFKVGGSDHILRAGINYHF